jgi:hypothetical protein
MNNNPGVDLHRAIDVTLASIQGARHTLGLGQTIGEVEYQDPNTPRDLGISAFHPARVGGVDLRDRLTQYITYAVGRSSENVEGMSLETVEYLLYMIDYRLSGGRFSNPSQERMLKNIQKTLNEKRKALIKNEPNKDAVELAKIQAEIQLMESEFLYENSREFVALMKKLHKINSGATRVSREIHDVVRAYFNRNQDTYRDYLSRKSRLNNAEHNWKLRDREQARADREYLLDQLLDRSKWGKMSDVTIQRVSDRWHATWANMKNELREEDFKELDDLMHEWYMYLGNRTHESNDEEKDEDTPTPEPTDNTTEGKDDKPTDNPTPAEENPGEKPQEQPEAPPGDIADTPADKRDINEFRRRIEAGEPMSQKDLEWFISQAESFIATMPPEEDNPIVDALVKAVEIAKSRLKPREEFNPDWQPDGELTPKDPTDKKEEEETEEAPRTSEETNGISEVAMDAKFRGARRASLTEESLPDPDRLLAHAETILRVKYNLFDYVNTGGVSANDKIVYAVVPEYWHALAHHSVPRLQTKQREYVTNNSPVLMLKEVSKIDRATHQIKIGGKFYQVVGTSSNSNLVGRAKEMWNNSENHAAYNEENPEAKKKNRTVRELIEDNNAPTEEAFLVTDKKNGNAISTNVVKVTAGRVEMAYDEKQNLKNRPMKEILKENTGRRAPQLGIVQSGGSRYAGVVGNHMIINRGSTTPGSVVLLVHGANGQLIPVGLKIATFSKDHFDANRDSEFMKGLDSAMAAVASARNKEEAEDAIKKLKEYVYLGRYGVSMAVTDNGIAIYAGEKHFRTNITFGNIPFGEKSSEEVAAIIESIKTIFEEETVKYNVLKNKINQTSYNERIYDANILSANIADPKPYGAYFYTTPIPIDHTGSDPVTPEQNPDAPIFTASNTDKVYFENKRKENGGLVEVRITKDGRLFRQNSKGEWVQGSPSEVKHAELLWEAKNARESAKTRLEEALFETRMVTPARFDINAKNTGNDPSYYIIPGDSGILYMVDITNDKVQVVSQHNNPRLYYLIAKTVYEAEQWVNKVGEHIDDRYLRHIQEVTRNNALFTFFMYSRAVYASVPINGVEERFAILPNGVVMEMNGDAIGETVTDADIVDQVRRKAGISMLRNKHVGKYQDEYKKELGEEYEVLDLIENEDGDVEWDKYQEGMILVAPRLSEMEETMDEKLEMPADTPQEVKPQENVAPPSITEFISPDGIITDMDAAKKYIVSRHKTYTSLEILERYIKDTLEGYAMIGQETTEEKLLKEVIDNMGKDSGNSPGVGTDNPQGDIIDLQEAFEAQEEKNRIDGHDQVC